MRRWSSWALGHSAGESRSALAEPCDGCVHARSSVPRADADSIPDLSLTCFPLIMR